MKQFLRNAFFISSKYTTIIRHLVISVLFGLHGWMLIFKLPCSLWKIVQALWPNAGGVRDRDFWAFGSRDAGFRPWYNKIARDYKIQGRFGFAWDDGLGMPLGDRIYNNLATYWLLGKLGVRRMMLIGFLLMNVFSVLTIGWAFGSCWALITLLFIAGSPIIISSFTHIGKPEMFWWGFAIPIILAVFSNNALIAGLLWSFLAFVNLSVSVLLVFLLGIPALFKVYFAGELPLLLLCAFPGIVKLGIRGIYMLRTGFLANLSSEQARIWKRPWYPTGRELIIFSPFVFSILVTAIDAQAVPLGAVLLMCCIGLLWINYRLFYMSDIHSLYLAFWVIALCFSCIYSSYYGLALIITFLYTSPRFCMFPTPAINECPECPKRNFTMRLQHFCRTTFHYLRDYPSLKPMQHLKPEELMFFFNTIPEKTRILVESDGDMRTQSQLRSLWQWTEEFLPLRQIDIANEMYTRLVEPELVDNYLTKFCSREMNPKKMLSLCNALGVSYIIAFSSATIEALENAGFNKISAVDMAHLNEFCQIVRTPPLKLTLLKSPYDTAVVEPSTVWERQGNEIFIQAQSNEMYTIRYRYNSQFRAFQDGYQLSINPIKPIEDIPLQFMKVKAKNDGQLIVKFHSKWI